MSLNTLPVKSRGRALAFVTIAVCLCLAGCTRAQLIKKITPPEDESYARRYVDLLRQRSFGQIRTALDSGVVDPDLSGTLAKMAGFFPAGEPNSVKVVNFSWNARRVPRTDSLTLEYEFPDKWLLVDLTIAKKDGTSTITAFRVTQIPDSLEHANRFTLVGKSALQYLVLTLAVAALIFSFYVFVICIRSRPLKRKWLWAIFVLVGVGKLGVNWNTGALTMTPLAVNIPCGGGGTTGGPYGEWIVSVYPPLGAFIFLKKRRDSLKPTQLDPVEGELPSLSPPEPTSPTTQQSST